MDANVTWFLWLSRDDRRCFCLVFYFMLHKYVYCPGLLPSCQKAWSHCNIEHMGTDCLLVVYP